MVTHCQELTTKTNTYVTDTCGPRRGEALLLCWGPCFSVVAASKAGILLQFTIWSRRAQWLQILGEGRGEPSRGAGGSWAFQP